MKLSADLLLSLFERGFGTTVGNSSSSNFAFFTGRCGCNSHSHQGLEHEFSSIPGSHGRCHRHYLNIKSLIVKLEVMTPRNEAGCQEGRSDYGRHDRGRSKALP